MNQIPWSVCWTLLLVIKSPSDQHQERLPSWASLELGHSSETRRGSRAQSSKAMTCPQLGGRLPTPRMTVTQLPSASVSHTSPTSHFFTLSHGVHSLQASAYQEFWPLWLLLSPVWEAGIFIAELLLGWWLGHSLADLALASHPWCIRLWSWKTHLGLAPRH